MAGDRDVPAGAAPAPLHALLAFPLVFVGLSATAGSVQSAPTDSAPAMGLLFACVILAPAVLLLEAAARGLRRSAAWTGTDAWTWMPYVAVSACFAVAAAPVVSAMRSHYVAPSAALQLAGALALEAGLVLLLAAAPWARRGLLIALAALSVAGVLAAYPA
jgi:hypothetical protein